MSCLSRAALADLDFQEHR